MSDSAVDSMATTRPARAALPRRRLLGVDGVDGSGKSFLAERLGAALGEVGLPTVLLRVDDFRRPIDWRQAGRSEAEVYYDDYYDLALLDACASRFLAGADAVEIPAFDSRVERHVGTRTVEFGPASVALVEGVFALRLQVVRASAAVVYLRTTLPEAQRRILARDTARGRTADDVMHRIAARYFPAHERYVRECDPVGSAAALIDHETLGGPTLVRLDRARLGPVVAEALSRAMGAFAPTGTVG